MTTIGIDLGTHKISFAVFEGTELAHALGFDVGTDAPRDTVLAELGHLAHDMALNHSADRVWVENAIMGNNRKYSLQIAQVQGAVLADLATVRLQIGTDIRGVDNKAWKKKVIGNGNASKEQIKNYIVDTHPQYALLCGEDQDLYDAVCVGLYGLQLNEQSDSLHLIDTSE